MRPQVPGKIYLADQRGVLENSQFRRQSTFSFGTYQSEHKVPFGRLYGLNEETLAGGHAVEFVVAEDSYIILLPITGAVEYSTCAEVSSTVEAEEAVTLTAPVGTVLRLHNPFANELISFLHLWVRAPAPLLPLAPAGSLKAVLEAQMLENQLCELAGAQPQLPFRLSLGRFMGRQEAVYHVAPSNTLFAFVLAGAFELEGRLLHEKDAVALWDVAEIELEALSNHALVLLLELTL